ncbi:MAG: thiamine phosphate synthase [Gemmatimonadota bacterium]|nr:MAG: thiamine phosphate synthase [Gemmatimonadota bacterium]
MRLRLHLVTNDEVLARPDFVAVASEVMKAGGVSTALHVRGPGTRGSDLYRIVRDLACAVEDSKASLVVNDRIDVALALGLEWVHLGQRSLPPAIARDLLGTQGTVGVSVHDVAEARKAVAGGADYLTVGTMFATSSHPERTPLGPTLLEAVQRTTSLPLVAIGGITPDRVEAAVASGALGVAVLGGVWGGERPEQAVGVYLAALDRAGCNARRCDEDPD